MAAQYPLLTATAVGNVLLALGHTAKGLEQFKHPSLKNVQPTLRKTLTIGWFEGSVFFAIAGLLNYKWATNGLVDVIDKSIAGALTSLLVTAGLFYVKAGDKPTGLILAAVGFLQGLGIKSAL